MNVRFHLPLRIYFFLGAIRVHVIELVLLMSDSVRVDMVRVVIAVSDSYLIGHGLHSSCGVGCCL